MSGADERTQERRIGVDGWKWEGVVRHWAERTPFPFVRFARGALSFGNRAANGLNVRCVPDMPRRSQEPDERRQPTIVTSRVRSSFQGRVGRVTDDVS